MVGLKLRQLGMLAGLIASGGIAWGDLPRAGDVAFGLSRNAAAETLEIVRGPVAGPGVNVPDPWTSTSFIQSVEFDNLNNISHNAQGNLLGLNFGTSTTSGQIYSFATTTEGVPGGQLIGDTVGIGGAGLTRSRLSGLSVSPDNLKIAVVAYDVGSVLVYDYTAGDTMGGNAVLQGGRSSSATLIPSSTQGTAWLDNDTALAFAADGGLFEIDATSMNASSVGFFPTSFGNSMFTDLEYNSAISPYIYASFSQFQTATGSTNELFVIDPRNGYSLVKKITLSTSANTLREIALDAEGNLFIGQFGNVAAGGPRIDVLLDVVSNPAGLTDDSSLDWYQSPNSSQFNGLDVALGPNMPTVDADFNDNGTIGCDDVNPLVNAIVNTPANLAFDLTADGTVDADDLTQWLADAGNANLPSHNPYRRGDANLDGVVDGSDFNIWNSNKFTSNPAWCSGDFSADGSIDGSDFNIWNSNKFTSSDSSLVPEPVSSSMLLVGVLCLGWARRRR